MRSRTGWTSKGKVEGFLGELPRDWLLACLLLSVREGEASGGELMKEMRELGFGAVRPGEVFGVLRQLKQEGLVSSEAGCEEYMLSRRRYAITAHGEAHLERMANALGQYRGEVERFFRLYERGPLQKVPG